MSIDFSYSIKSSIHGSWEPGNEIHQEANPVPKSKCTPSLCVVLMVLLEIEKEDCHAVRESDAVDCPRHTVL